MPRESALQFAEHGQFSQVRAFAGDVLYTEGMPASHLYVVKDGEVDLYLVRDEKRTVVETLRKGQCFGMEPHLKQHLRLHCAAARSYSELFLIPAEAVHDAIADTPDLAQSLMQTMSIRLAMAHRLIATRINYQPDLLIYAQLLHLLGIADLGRQASAPRRAGHAHNQAHGQAPQIARPTVQEVFSNARLLFGHSDKHIRSCLGKLLSLHLVRIEDERGDCKQLLYSPSDIVSQVRKIMESEVEHDKQSYEYISVDEFAALVDVDRTLVLRKLAAGEFGDDIFTFRRAEVLRLLNEKGRRYFAERRIKPPADFSDIADLEFADSKSIFTAISKVDTLDLARLLSTLEEGPARTKVLGSLSQRRREELDSDLKDMGPVDPMEVQRLGQSIIGEVKTLMLQTA
jgi:CRP-like cAMP-binding protein